MSNVLRSYIGLDLGTSCGFARLDLRPGVGHSWFSGTWNCAVGKFDSPSLRFEAFERQLSDQLTIGCDRLFYELVARHLGTQAAHVYGAFQAKMMEVCDRFGVPYVGIPVGTIKKFATGKGNASKDQMVAAARAWGLDPKTEDEADALAIVRCGWETRS